MVTLAGVNTVLSEGISIAQRAAVQTRLRTQSNNDRSMGTDLGPPELDKDRIILAGVKNRRIVFNLTPEMSESKSVSYTEKGPGLRMPSSIIWFDGSPSRTYQINAKFLARTTEEAGEVFDNLNLLRSWTVPDKGITGGEFGITPEIVKLYGYGEVFRGVPCGITTLNIEYPTDVDYIKSSNGSMIPILQSVSITLKEAHTTKDVSTQFNIETFRNGTLYGW